MAKVGQPTKYKEEYCQTAVEYLGQGHSIEALAGQIGVNKSTIRDWGLKYPEFRAALDLGILKAVGVWEDLLLAAAKGNSKGNPAAIIFGLKNRAASAWSDKIVNEVTGKDGGPVAHSVEITFVEADE